MAYVSQEMKKEKAPKIKEVFKKYGIKGSIGVKHYSTLVVNISSGKIDFISNYGKKFDSYDGKEIEVKDIQVNTFHIGNSFSGVAKDCLEELNNVMMAGNHNNSDIQSDYFDVGFYTSINIGQWDKPYIYQN